MSRWRKCPSLPQSHPLSLQIKRTDCGMCFRRSAAGEEGAVTVPEGRKGGRKQGRKEGSRPKFPPLSTNNIAASERESEGRAAAGLRRRRRVRVTAVIAFQICAPTPISDRKPICHSQSEPPLLRPPPTTKGTTHRLAFQAASVTSIWPALFDPLVVKQSGAVGGPTP